MRVLRAMQAAEDPDRVHFYSSSGGNAGLGCVNGANFVRRPSTVVVPKSTKAHMVAKIRAAGATDVIQYGESWYEADQYMRETVMRLAREKGEDPVYVSPFDHPDIWEGHSTMVDEVKTQLEKIGEGPPDLMVCSCGGGGLFIGVMQGIERQGKEWDRTQVLVMNTVGADALAESVKKGQQVTLPRITSIATSLGAVRVGDRTWEVAEEGVASGKVKSAVLTDAEALMGVWRFVDDEGILVEPACGVNIALCFGGRLKRALGRPVQKDEKVVLVVCGGQNVSTSLVEEWRQEYGGLVEQNGVNGHANGHVTSNGVP